jgi:glyoxylase-like metal-dependent hydrolase (beta-lactamase superfamily II)
MKLTPIVLSRFVSDGGCMFGLVPRPIWSKLVTPDERNGIPQNANSLLVELDDGRRGIVDAGCGNPVKFDDKARRVHGLAEPWPLEQALGARGLRLKDLDFVLFTHLHWDHAGGVSGIVGEDLCPQATFFLHAWEWEDATEGNPLLYKSYPAEVIQPLKRHAKMTLVRSDEHAVLPGVTLIRSGGHTRGHATWWFHSPKLILNHPDAASLGPVNQALFAGDVCPSRHHLRMVFQAAYDTYPLDTRAWKRQWLPHVAAERIPIFFGHDPEVAGGLIRPDPAAEFVLDAALPWPRA